MAIWLLQVCGLASQVDSRSHRSQLSYHTTVHDPEIERASNLERDAIQISYIVTTGFLNNLGCCGNRKPSNELWLMIATYLVRECAVVTAQVQTQEHTATDFFVDLFLDVHAHYITVEGVRYVKLLLDALKAGTIQKLYVTKDHVGHSRTCKGVVYLGNITIHLPSNRGKLTWVAILLNSGFEW